MQRLQSDATQTLVTLLVFSLSSGVLAGILFYTDSTGPYVLDELANSAPIHMKIQFTNTFYSQGDGSTTEIMDFLANQDQIAASEHVLTIDGHYDHLWFSPYRRYVHLGVADGFLETYADCIQLSPESLELTEGGCYVDESIFTEAGLRIGDPYNVTVVEPRSQWGDTHYIIRTLEVRGSFESTNLWGRYKQGEDSIPILRAIMTKSTLQTEFGLIGYGVRNALSHRIWVKMQPSFLQNSDTAEAEEQIDTLRKTIAQNIAPHASITELAALSVVRGYASWRSSMIAIAIAFTIPSFVMGIILVNYTSELVSDKRRNEVGMLRMRGASSRAAAAWVLDISLLTGFLGAAGAVAIGFLAALLSGNMRGFLVLSTSAFSVVLQPQAVLFVFGFSFCMGLFASVLSIIRVLLLSPSETHREVHEDKTETEETYAPIIEIAIAGISSVVVMMLLPYMGAYAASSRSPFTSFMTVVAFGAFIISLTKFLARPTAHLKSSLMRKIADPRRVGGTSVMGGYSRMKSKTEALGVMFIALVFMTAMFSAIVSDTGSNHVRNLLAFDVGADILMELNPSMANSTEDLGDALQAIAGVEHVSGMLIEKARVSYLTIGPYATVVHDRQISVYGVQPDEWASAAFFLPCFAEGQNPEESVSAMADNWTQVLSSFRPVVGYDVEKDASYAPVYGNEVTLSLLKQGTEAQFNVTIIDILSEDSSEDSPTYLPGAPEEDEFILLNMNLLHDRLNTSRVDKFYLRLAPDANHTAVISELREVGGHNILTIESTMSQQQAIVDSRSARTIHGVFSLNVIFTIIYLSIGMALIAVQKNESLRKHFSVVRALGSETESVQQALLLDSFLSIAIAAAIGIPLGLLLSLLILGTPLSHTGVSGSVNWQRLPMALSIPHLTLSIIIALSFIAPLVLTHVVTKHYLKAQLADGLRTAG